MAFPDHRLQRLRRTGSLRDLVAETRLHANNFVMPIFVNEALSSPRAIKSLSGIYQQSFTSLLDEIRDCVESGIKAVLLFGIPEKKDSLGSEADNPNGVIQLAIGMIKTQFPDLVVIADCCLCEYTDHGHCGVLKDGALDNDDTLSRLARIAVSYAKAGADVVAPSGMMDGMVRVIRRALDQAGYQQVSIMSYAAKYASALYGPFREAAGSGQFSGDRKHHQMAPSQSREALLEAQLDVEEGSDFLIVKPATLYLDIIRAVHDRFLVPVVAYHVSGEYAMVKAASGLELLDEAAVFEETFLAMKRAGAHLIISYYAKEMARKLK
ncbi:MAG: porphobilinogen synthase [Candidatus Margulisbacteria bacterium]|nr:porphobilinogen synthase [Candidatus Margulisiibacteriota bacterium]